MHTYARYLGVTNDHLRKEPFLDVYTAARAVPQVYALGLSLAVLKDVKGANTKLRELCSAPSVETDARSFEILVAASFARTGHDVAFIDDRSQKMADLRVHGLSIPIVVECKRRQPLNDYENKEFEVIPKLFALLCDKQERMGLVGQLTIDFRQEIASIPMSEIVDTIEDLTKSLSLHAYEED